MKKTLLIGLSAVLLSACGICANSNLDILTLFSSKSNSDNKVWVGTFQLVFNDMKNNILKKDVKFVGERPTKELIALNNEEFNKTMLNESSYYTSYGKTSPKAKEQIIKDIKAKFNETSDILDQLDWTENAGSFYSYAMLKKEFEFFEEFDILEKMSFNNSEKKYSFFGITDSSKKALDDNLKVLFYNNKNDYAVELLTKSKDRVLLYRTNKNSSFDKLFAEMTKKSEKFKGNRSFASIDTLKIPNLKLKGDRKYPQLCNKTIEGTNFYFSQAIETIQLELDNKGGKVKSEAALMMKCNMMAPEKEEAPRHFDFDKTFVMFLLDSGKENPYLALRVKNLEELGK